MFNWLGRVECDGPAVLDEAYLERLNSHLGEDTLRELMSDGLLELVDRIETVRIHTESDDVDALSKVVHDIAGMSGHLGLARLSLVAVQTERNLRDVQTAGSQATSLLAEEVPQAVAALRNFLDGAGEH